MTFCGGAARVFKLTDFEYSCEATLSTHFGFSAAIASVSASPQYSSRLGRQASVVEGDDGDSFEESD